MNEGKNGALLYETNPAVAGLNKVPGFDPRRFLRREISEATGEEVLKLGLKYKKLWFRLAHPKGRIHLNALRITDQLAIIEAQVYLDRSDPKPISSFTSQRSAADTPSGLYVQEAEQEAMNEALDNAGFGLQFCDVSHPENDKYGTEIPLHREQAPQAAEPVKQAAPSAPPAPSGFVARQEAPLPPTVNAAPAPAAVHAPVSQMSEKTEPTPQPVAMAEQAALVEEAPVPTEPAVRQASALPPKMEPAPASAAVQTPARQTAEKMEPVPQAAAAVNPSPVEMGIRTSSPAAPVQTGAVELHTAADQQEKELPAEEAAPVQPAGTRYTPDMSVEEIAALMTLEEARSLVVDVGICKGWTMAQVAERRAASLKWYLYSDQIKDNTVKAAADKMLQHLAGQQKAS